MTSLGDRMKGYEQAARTYLTRRMPVIIRVDGKAFHSFTKGHDKPWDLQIRDSMTEAAKYLMEEIQGAKLAYVQSDEISVLITDYDSLESEAWFNKNVLKMTSVAASMATMAFNKEYVLGKRPREGWALFDARPFVLPKEEVCNYFIWRQQDAVRNSIQGLGQKYFSHKQLHGVNCKEIQENLFNAFNVNWNDCETWQKRGWTLVRKMYETSVGDDLVFRSVVEPDWDIPTFTQDRDYIDSRIYVGE